MIDEHTTVVLGIPIPSTDPAFLAIVGIHVLFGLAAVTTGAVAMLTGKGVGVTQAGARFIFGVCLACSRR